MFEDAHALMAWECAKDVIADDGIEAVSAKVGVGLIVRVVIEPTRGIHRSALAATIVHHRTNEQSLGQQPAGRDRHGLAGNGGEM